MVNITILNNVFSKTDKAGKKILDPCLTVTKTYWKQTQYRKIERSYQCSMISRKMFFLTGFLPRIKKFCDDNDHKLNIIKPPTVSAPVPNPHSFTKFVEEVKKIFGHNFREHQLEKQISLIKTGIQEKRGVLLSPTGTGKTTLALGVAAHFPKQKVLYICHTRTLVEQTAKEFERFGFKTTKVMGNDKNQSGDVVVATRQSIINEKLEKYAVVMVDEVHHISDEHCSYGDILKNIDTPYRFGFTATFHEKKLQSRLAIEGHIGQVVGELTMKKAQKMKILAKPKLHIIKVPKQFIQSRKYNDVYNEAVVYSRIRNRLIANTIRDYLDDNNIVMTFVTKIDHGREIQRIAENVFGLKIPMVQGATQPECRERTKNGLLEKKLNCVIATTVWKEGINIPTFDVIINASGGKDDLQTMQLIGRGLRLSEGKTKMVFVDFFDDCSPYLIKHFGNRISLYSSKGWL